MTPAGAFFGTTFPHLLFQCYRDLAPAPVAAPGSHEKSVSPLGDFRHLVDVQDESTIARNGGFRDGRGRDTTLPPAVLGHRTPNARLYIPRIYGFRVSEHAKSGPRMKWMRTRPETYEELMKKLPPGSSFKPVAQATPSGQQKMSEISEEEAEAAVMEEANDAKSDAMLISENGR